MNNQILKGIGIIGTTVASFAQEWIAILCGVSTFIILFPKVIATIRGKPVRKSEDE